MLAGSDDDKLVRSMLQTARHLKAVAVPATEALDILRAYVSHADERIEVSGGKR